MEFHSFILDVIFALRPVTGEIDPHTHFLFGYQGIAIVSHSRLGGKKAPLFPCNPSKQPTKCHFTSSCSRSQLRFCSQILTVLWKKSSRPPSSCNTLWRYIILTQEMQILMAGPKRQPPGTRMKGQRARAAEFGGGQPAAVAWMHSHKGIVILSRLGFINELSGFQAPFPRCLAVGPSLRL